MKKTDKKTKWKYGVLAIVFSLAFVAPEVFQFADFGTVEKNQPISWFDPRLSDFFYDDTIDETSYPFNAHNESYIVCKVQNTAYANFTLDSVVYNISYGINYIPINFGNENKTYTVTFHSYDISRNIYDWFTVQPVIIDSGNVAINPDTTTDLTFESAGLISFFIIWDCSILNNFTYDELYVEYDGTVINEIREDWTHEKEIDPLIVSVFKFEGSYIQYDIFTEPRQHTIKLKGNSTVEYKIVVSGDWDEDGFSNSVEIQNFKLEPSLYNLLEPAIYGYFLKGDSYKQIIDPELENGYFFLNIPISFNDQFLKIRVLSGSIANITVDDDEHSFKDVVVKNKIFSQKPTTLYYGRITPGQHFISYKYVEECVVCINFYLNGTDVPVISYDEITDIDSDGLSNMKEKTLGTNEMISDHDNDSLIDGYDASPKSSLTINNSMITEVVIPDNKFKDTVVSITIKNFENDFATSEPKIWKDMRVTILPGLRVFGNSTITKSDLIETYEKQFKSYDLTNSDSSEYGDGIPDIENENEESLIVLPNVAEKTITYNLNYDIGSLSKTDSKLKIRFDFVWCVVSHEANTSGIIHYYSIEEPVVIQSIVSTEIDDVYYILGSPDSMIEHEMLWNLAQNHNLGTFASFGLSSDVVSSGFDNHSTLMDTLIEARESDPISTDENGNIDENEVILLQKNFLKLICFYAIIETFTVKQAHGVL